MSDDNKVDIKYAGIPNICFSCYDDGDKREEFFAEQRKERGFDDSETWSLDCTLVKFLKPRLEVFLEISKKKIVIEEEFENDIIAIIAMCDDIISEDCVFKKEKYESIIERGLEAFKRSFCKLSW